MSAIAIITDSIACLTQEHIQQYNIGVVPINIFFNGKVYQDWVDITPTQAYEFLEKAPEFWKSSAPSPEDYLKVYREASQHALVAARASTEGKTFDEVINAAKRVKERVKFLALLETIHHAYRTGRIPKIASQIGSFLSIKPILTAKNGLIHFVTATSQNQREGH